MNFDERKKLSRKELTVSPITVRREEKSLLWLPEDRHTETEQTAKFPFTSRFDRHPNEAESTSENSVLVYKVKFIFYNIGEEDENLLGFLILSYKNSWEFSII